MHNRQARHDNSPQLTPRRSCARSRSASTDRAGPAPLPPVPGDAALGIGVGGTLCMPPLAAGLGRAAEVSWLSTRRRRGIARAGRLVNVGLPANSAATLTGRKWPVAATHQTNLNGRSRGKVGGRLHRAYDREGSIAPSNDPSQQLRRTGDRCSADCRRSTARRSDTGYRFKSGSRQSVDSNVFAHELSVSELSLNRESLLR